jgi:flagellum-specific ATP synthase
LENLLNKSTSLFYDRLESRLPYGITGKIKATKGLVFEAYLKNATLGSCVKFICDNGETSLGEVVGLKEQTCFIMPYNEMTGINQNTRLKLLASRTRIKINERLLGRVVDYSASPMDGKGDIIEPHMIAGVDYQNVSIFGQYINPLSRKPIKQNLITGIRAIDCFNCLGKGQRIAIMAGSGVGKSVLMGMMSKRTEADINVIALIGERGREVREFIENELGEEGLKKSVIVVATSDTSPLMRIRAAYTATRIAEYFRDKNKDVLLMMDSVTRFAMANREIGMSVGEAPGPRGYGPSVFSKLPKLLERAGNSESGGSITGIYTVLVEGDDMDEPVADNVRAIADGHLVLSRDLAAKNHYPAIDILQSISRVMPNIVNREHKIISGHLKDLLSTYRESEDLINVGAYAKGLNPKLDKAVIVYNDIINLLRQDVDEEVESVDLYDQMVEIARKAEKEVNPELFEEQQE